MALGSANFSYDINIKDYMISKYIPANMPEPVLQVIYSGKEVTEQPAGITHGQLKCPNLVFPLAQRAVFAAPIKIAKTLVAEDEDDTTIKKVIELTLETSHFSNFKYLPGDTIGILTRNSDQEVEEILNLMQLDYSGNTSCKVQVLPYTTKKNIKVPAHIPEETTPFELLRDCLNIRAVLKKQFLRALAEHCTNPEERNFFNCLSSKEGTIHYNTLILEKGVTMLDLLKSCTSCKPTLELLIEHLPRLMPRPYSIANSPLNHPNEVKIIFSVFKHRPGVCTHMLEQMAKYVEQNPIMSPPKVLTYLRKPNKFRFTSEDVSNTNQIFICVGTGLAPFLGFLEHKQQLGRMHGHISLGVSWLFFGATVEGAIIHLRKLEQFLKDNILNKYFESLSRDPVAPFHYVQEQLNEHAYELVEYLLHANTVLYVCADGADISKSIEMAICVCLMKALAIPLSEATQMIKNFRANNKYREDLWV